jgi:hypothetical protein
MTYTYKLVVKDRHALIFLRQRPRSVFIVTKQRSDGTPKQPKCLDLVITFIIIVAAIDLYFFGTSTSSTHQTTALLLLLLV